MTVGLLLVALTLVALAGWHLKDRGRPPDVVVTLTFDMTPLSDALRGIDGAARQFRGLAVNLREFGRSAEAAGEAMNRAMAPIVAQVQRELLERAEAQRKHRIEFEIFAEQFEATTNRRLIDLANVHIARRGEKLTRVEGVERATIEVEENE